MDFLTDIMRQISVIAVMAAFVELLLPNGEMQKFIRFFMGLLILIAFLNPFIKGQLFHEEITAAEMAEVIEEPAGQLSTEEILAKGKKMDTALFSEAESQMKEDMSLQLLALVRLVPGVKKAAVDIAFQGDGSGNIAQVQLSLMVAAGTDQEQVKRGIYDLLAAFYHIPKEKIQWVIKEVAANDNNGL